MLTDKKKNHYFTLVLAGHGPPVKEKDTVLQQQTFKKPIFNMPGNHLKIAIIVSETTITRGPPTPR